MKFKILLILPLLAILNMGSDCDPDKECDRSSDCASWQECSAGLCIDKPAGSCQFNFDCVSGEECVSGMCQEKPKLSSGAIIIGCNCSSTSAFPGQTSPNNSCSSGSDVIQSCGQCCFFDNFGNCLGVSWRKVCL